MGNPAVYMRQKWQPIATAPANAALELSIYDKGEYHELAFPVSARAPAGAMCAQIVRSFLRRHIGDFGTKAAPNEDEARKYRRLAEEANDPLIKQELLELADICDKVADNIEDRMTAG